jgi:hypothetical protein
MTHRQCNLQLPPTREVAKAVDAAAVSQRLRQSRPQRQGNVLRAAAEHRQASDRLAVPAQQEVAATDL